MAIAPFLAVAQQLPAHGCNAVPSCRPLGFSTLTGNAGGTGSTLFGVGFSWDPGFNFNVFAPGISRAPKPTPPPDGPLFHLRASLLPPTPTPVPASTAAPPPGHSQ